MDWPRDDAAARNSMDRGNSSREIGEDLYAWSFGHTVKVTPRTISWLTDRALDTAIKFDPEGRVRHGVRPQAGSLRRGHRAAETSEAAAAGRGRPLPPGHDVAWDKAGNTFISDGYINSRVAKVDKDGNWLKSWGDRGKEPGQLQHPPLDRDRRRRQRLCRRPRQSPHPGVRRRRQIPASVHDQRSGAAGCQACDRQDSGRGDDGRRHLPSRLALVDLHHAAAQPGALQLATPGPAASTSSASTARCWACSAVRQAVKTIRLDHVMACPSENTLLCGGAAELAGAEADPEAVRHFVVPNNIASSRH